MTLPPESLDHDEPDEPDGPLDGDGPEGGNDDLADGAGSGSGAAGTAGANGADDMCQEALDVIQRQSRQMARLLDDLLDARLNRQPCSVMSSELPCTSPQLAI